MSDVAWQQLQSLPLGTPVVHWSILKGNLNGKFSLVEVTGSTIIVQTGPGTLRRISRSDFDNVARLWPEYKQGAVDRHTLSEVTLNSTYILSLLHLLDDYD
jgi:hypothetical protein